MFKQSDILDEKKSKLLREKSKKIRSKNPPNPLKYFLTCYRINLPKKGNNKQKCKKHT